MVFKPKEFITSALQNSKVALTWDEDDNERFKMTRRAFNKDDLKKMDFQSYLASSNDEDSSDEEDPEAVRQKYKALLAAKSDNEEDGEDADGDMEVTFAPGLSEMASQLLDKRKEKTQRNHETVFETSLRERREKRKSKKAGAKKGDVEDEDAAAASGDDDYDGLDASEAADPFFQDAFDEAEFGPAPVPKKESVEKSEKKQKGKKGMW